MLFRSILTVLGTYKARFGGADDAGIYGAIDSKATSAGQGIFAIALKVGVFVSAITIVIAFLLMIWYSRRPDKREETKALVTRRCLTCIGIFSVPTMIGFIIGMHI